MNSKDFCNNVVTIPQFLGTCWFNAILMSILYSQTSRKLLLHLNKFKTRKSPYFKIFYEILYKNYISPEKSKEYFNIMRPEKILSYLIKNKKELDDVVKNGWSHNMFLPIFIKKIGMKSHSFEYYNGKFYCGISENIYIKSIKNKMKYLFKISILLDKVNEIKYAKKNPEYLFVNMWDNLGNQKDHTFIDNFITESIKAYGDKHTLGALNIKYSGLDTFDDIIIFNGDKYILDSCILANYNKDNANGHAITGITCKNKKYVYNGWMRSTIDPAKNDMSFIAGTLPCELMKYDWDVHKDAKFCINPLGCNIKELNKSPQEKIQCFSFNKGKRTLVYVKMSSKYKSLDENKSLDKKTNNLKQFRGVIKTNLNEIKKLLELKLKKKIEDPKNREEIKIISNKIIKLREENKRIRNDIKIHMNANANAKPKANVNASGIITKQQYINKIKELYPHYVNLQSYSINELKEIYNRYCPINVLDYHNNSCYLDTLLFALFNKKNKYIEQYLLNAPVIKYSNAPRSLYEYGKQIQVELNRLYNVISSQTSNKKVEKCSALRKLFKSYNDLYNKHVIANNELIEWKGSQTDYNVVLNIFNKIFNIDNSLKVKITTSTDRIENRLFIDFIANDLLINNNTITIKNHYYDIFTADGKKYKHKIEYLKGEMLFMYFNRTYVDNADDYTDDRAKKINSKIIPAIKLKLKENKKNIYLNSIIIHDGSGRGGHYTCLYDCNGIWYKFDDIATNKITKIGTFDDIIKNNNYTQNITGLYYW